jgi:D-alanyl-D-alanine-carboxypeptidase/D-alanyl-D-alanine-endopeptidase
MTRGLEFAVAVFLGLTATLTGAQSKQSSATTVFPSDAEIRKILAGRVDTLAGPQDGIGIVVGVIGPKGRRVIPYGHLNQADPRPLGGDTLFEIGSVSKVFTALLLADMARKGEVALADPVAKYLPAGVKIPERDGRSITLVDLATHTSGLPFMPDELPVFNASIAANDSTAQLYRFLARYQLTRDPGAEWDYSNIGYWLLGQTLAARAGMDYESLLRTRVIVPLKMKSTAITLSSDLKARLAVGHNAVLQPALPFSSVSPYGAMPAAGGVVSNVNDLLTFLAVAMGYEPSPSALSMTAMLYTRRPIDGDGSEQALGWVVTGKGNDQLVTHDGFTWGYASYVAWNPATRAGVVVLSNQQTSVGDIGRHLLLPNMPLEPPTVRKHTEIKVASTVLDAYAGQYQVEGVGLFNIVRDNHVRDNDFLTIQLPADWGLPKLRLRPESRQDFFVAELPVRVTFQTDSEGRVSGLLLYPPRGQHALSANRLRSEK